MVAISERYRCTRTLRLTGGVWFYTGGSMPKGETKKEKQKRIAKEMMYKSWNTYDCKSENSKKYMSRNFTKPKTDFQHRKH